MTSLSSSQEDYLETILGLILQTGSARTGDIAARLRVAKPSVTAALRALARRNLAIYEPYRRIRLTDAGRTAAQRVLRRHETIRSFFTDVLGVNRRTADRNACRIEHAIDETVMRRLSEFIAFASSRPAPAHRLPDAFRAHLRRQSDAKPEALSPPEARTPPRRRRAASPRRA